MTGLVEFVNALSVSLLAGAAVHQQLLRKLSANSDQGQFASNIRRRRHIIMFAGLLLFAASAASRTGTNWVLCLQLLAAVVSCAAVILNRKANSLPLTALAFVAVFGLAICQSLGSHAADEAGALPLLASTLHWAVAACWFGALAHTLLQPAGSNSSADDPARQATLSWRYAVLSLAAFAVLAVSGGILAFIHVHNVDALNSTGYGSVLKIKAALLIVLLLVVCASLLRNSPRRTQAANAKHKAAARFRRADWLHCGVLAAVLLASALLAARSPPGFAPFLNPQMWQLSSPDLKLSVEVQPVSGRPGQIRFRKT